MRPIALKVEGLHSFREAQEVDFTQLCAGGVFGIFGPTGSGKSTLLDAITLALYGKVDRAPNNTQGIINHAEKRVVVSFTFELGQAQSAKRYKVERQFKRSGAQSVNTTACRLLDVTGEPVVLADKTNEVNRLVVQLLGLSSEDFTRAVVLPQGKFAEFISLKGTERRQMLQRLFNLEQYGDRLRQKVSQRYQEMANRLNEVRAEQAGLGDASIEALQRARVKVRQAEKALAQAEEAREKAEQELAVKQKIWEQQLERERLQAELQRLKELNGKIDLLERRVQQAEWAEKLLPYAEEFERSTTALHEGEEKLAEAQKRREAKWTEYQAQKSILEQLLKRKAEEEPLLRVRLEQLKQGLDWQKKWMDLKKGVAQLEEQIAQLEQRRREGAARLAKEKGLLQKGEEKQRWIKEEIARTEVSHQTKTVILQAYQTKREIDRLRQNIEELHQEHGEREKELDKVRREEERLQGEVADYRNRLMQLIKQNRQLDDAVRQSQNVLEQLSTLYKQQLASLKDEMEKSEQGQLAAQLAKELSPGCPCPVCGSLDHPAPASTEGVELGNLSELIDRLLPWEDKLHQLQLRLSPLSWRLEQLFRQFEGQLRSLDTAYPALTSSDPSKSLAVASSKLQFVHASEIQTLNQFSAETQRELAPTKEEKPGLCEYEEYEEQLKRVCRKMLEELDELELGVKQHQQQADEWQHRFHKDQEALTQVAQMAQILERGQKERKIKLTQLKQQLEGEIRSWKARFPYYTLEGIEEEQERLAASEAQSEELRQRLEKSFTFLEEKQETINRLTDELNRLEVQLAQKQVELASQKEMEQDLFDQLRHLTHDGDLHRTIGQVEQELHRLNKEEEAVRQAFAQAEEAWQQAEQQLVRASEARNTARNRWQTADKIWREKLSPSPFKQLVDVKAAVLPEKELTAYKERIEEHREQEREIRVQLHLLLQQLEGKELSRGEWEEIQKRHLLVREKEAEAREERGAAIEFLKELEGKHQRYLELARKEQELTQRLTRYTQLQDVLRGNAFVEFLAEEHLVQVSRDASDRLKQLTRGRYALEVDSSGGFVIRDDANGSIKRPVSSLSGGETFLTSLALALSLSASIQLRGEYPLQFFFLDEGFGTLDPDLLDTVVSALECLHSQQMSVGVISHVPELRARLPRKLIVDPAEPGGRGSRLRLETM